MSPSLVMAPALGAGKTLVQIQPHRPFANVAQRRLRIVYTDVFITGSSPVVRTNFVMAIYHFIDDGYFALFKEGSDSHQNGKSYNDCPYPKDSRESNAWTEGWLDKDLDLFYDK